MMDEETVVAKVADIMRILDDVKKYNSLGRALKWFVTVAVFVSILLLLGLVVVFDVGSLLDSFEGVLFVVFSLLLFLIPVGGLIASVRHFKRKLNVASSEEWKQELSQGFPAALKLLMELDWERTLDEIALGRLTYILYGLLKTVAYFIVVLFALELFGNLLVITLIGSINPVTVVFFGLLAFPVVFLVVGNDLLRRYKEIHTLDILLLDLRWFSHEVGRYEFEA
jgi:hypothetical protein